MSEKVRALSRRNFLKAVAFTLGGAAIGGCLSHNPTPEPTPTRGPLPPEFTPTPIPGFAEYQKLWQEKKNLEVLGPGEKTVFPTGQMRLEIEYAGENKIFLDSLSIGKHLDVLFPRPPSPPSKSAISEQLAEKVNWAAQNVWRVTFVDHQEQLPKFGQTGLKEKAKRALLAKGLPEEVEEVTPLTCTYREKGNDWHTFIQMEPTGNLKLQVKEREGEEVQILPEKRNQWLSRSFRGSFLLVFELLRASRGGLGHLAQFPILEITCPNRPEMRSCQPVIWSHIAHSPNYIITPKSLVIMPVPKEVVPPSFPRFI